MTERSLKAVVVTALMLGAANVLMAGLLARPEIRATISAAILPRLISLTLVLPFAVQSIFFVAQLLPGGRGIVPLPFRRSDGWLFALLLSTLPSAFARDLAPFATDSFQYAGRGPQLTLILGVMLTLARSLQYMWAQAVIAKSKTHIAAK